MRFTVYNGYLYAVATDKGYNGYVFRWDETNFQQLFSWSGNGATRGFIFPRITANDKYVVFTYAKDDNGFHIMVSTDGVNFTDIGVEPFFDASLSGENHGHVELVGPNLLAFINTKDASSNNYLKLIDLNSNSVIYTGKLGYGHTGCMLHLNGKLYINMENTNGNTTLYILNPDVEKSLSISVSGNTVSVSGTNVSNFYVYKNFAGEGFGNLVASGTVPSSITLNPGVYRIIGV